MLYLNSIKSLIVRLVKALIRHNCILLIRFQRYVHRVSIGKDIVIKRQDKEMKFICYFGDLQLIIYLDVIN